jgi:translin
MIDEIQRISEAVNTRLTVLSQRRDGVLADCRKLVRYSANSIRASHRGDHSESDRELASATVIAAELQRLATEQPTIYWAGYVQDAMKEFAEARIVQAILSSLAIPAPAEIGVEDPAYLNGLAEAASELRRDILDLLRSESMSEAERLLAAMDDIYSLLITIDFPDSITGGLRRTTDALRAVLERTRGDVTVTLNQRRLERAIAEHQRSLSTTG